LQMDERWEMVPMEETGEISGIEEKGEREVTEERVEMEELEGMEAPRPQRVLELELLWTTLLSSRQGRKLFLGQNPKDSRRTSSLSSEMVRSSDISEILEMLEIAEISEIVGISEISEISEER
jgi:hypothetical protein